MQIARPSMVHPGTQGNRHIRDVSLRPISKRPPSICGCAATDRCWSLPLRLPHPVGFTRPSPHDVAKYCQFPPNTTPSPPGSCPPARTQFEDIPRQVRVGCDNIRKTVLAQPPGTVIMSHPIIPSGGSRVWVDFRLTMSRLPRGHLDYRDTGRPAKDRRTSRVRYAGNQSATTREALTVKELTEG